jgi:hypothetical protein
MHDRRRVLRLWFLIIICFNLAGCSFFSTSKPSVDQSPTATPTNEGVVVVPDKSAENPCEGVSGTLELQILVGPSEVVGLTPTTVGQIPFNVVSDGDIYNIEGGGPFDYFVETESYEWGTYTVTFEGDALVKGNCISTDLGGMLNVNVELIGEQNVEVVYEGISTNYPWSGTPQILVNLPLEEGAQEEGEGWVLILYLK